MRNRPTRTRVTSRTSFHNRLATRIPLRRRIAKQDDLLQEIKDIVKQNGSYLDKIEDFLGDLLEAAKKAKDDENELNHLRNTAIKINRRLLTAVNEVKY